jgi:anti-sigma factor RsiW
MKHPDRTILLLALDGELAGAAAAAVERHLETCDECRTAVDGLRETLRLPALVAHGIDAQEPASWNAPDFALPERVTTALREKAAARRGTRAAAANDERTAARAKRAIPPGAWRWAAGIVFVTTAAASAAIIAFPDAFRVLTREPAETVTTVESDRASLATTSTAVAVLPVDGRMEIVLTCAGPASRLSVVLGTGDDVVVDVAGAATARFEARDGRVVADLGGDAGDVSVTVPRTLRSGTIVANGRVVVRVAGERVTPAEALAGGMMLDAPAR